MPEAVSPQEGELQFTQDQLREIYGAFGIRVDEIAEGKFGVGTIIAVQYPEDEDISYFCIGKDTGGNMPEPIEIGEKVVHHLSERAPLAQALLHQWQERGELVPENYSYYVNGIEQQVQVLGVYTSL